MITYEEAQKILDLAGGSIRHWAHGIEDTRAHRRTVIEPGDVLRLRFYDGNGHPFELTPLTLQEALRAGVAADSITPDLADKLVQTAVFGRVEFTGELNAAQQDELEQSLAGMPVRDDDD
jgi:hypothetical protein